jgi:preprotein translocase subunit SecA
MPVPSDLSEKAIEEKGAGRVEEELVEHARNLYEEREKNIGIDNMRVLERLIMLRTIDRLWVEHLTAMEHMRLQAGWQTLRQTRSVDAYKREGYEQFQTLLETIRHDVAHTIFHVEIKKREDQEREQTPMAKVAVASGGGGSQKMKSDGHKTGRNAPCPCGSGKKYKHCCGK